MRKRIGMQEYRNLIKTVSEIVVEEDQRESKAGWKDNFFTIYDMERDEEHTHEKMLYLILNKILSKEIREEFVQKLLEILELPQNYQKISWEIEREHAIKNGRIDLFLSSRRWNKCIVFELKIDAPDQPRQLERYKEYVESCNYKDYRIVYLTLNGKDASEQSIGSADLGKIIYASFYEDIIGWLEQCEEICDSHNAEKSLITQYRILLQKLRGDDSMNERIRELIRDEDKLRACLHIRDILPDIQGEILYDFMSDIMAAFKKKKITVMYADIDCALEYYGNRSQRPRFLLPIYEFETRNYGIVYFCFEIEVYYHLRVCISFYTLDEDSYKKKNSRELLQKQKTIISKVKRIVEESLYIEIGENSNDELWSRWILDEEEECYDFKHITPDSNCAKLIGPEYRRKEAERIAKELGDDYKKLKKAFN